jgi:hypothetical protein
MQNAKFKLQNSKWIKSYPPKFAFFTLQFSFFNDL